MSYLRVGIAILVIICVGVAGSPALARPPHKKALADYLGPGLAGSSTTAAPATCPPKKGPTHSRTRPHNAFGKRLKAVRSAVEESRQALGHPGADRGGRR